MPYLYIGNIDAAVETPKDFFLYGVCANKCPSQTNEVLTCIPTALVSSAMCSLSEYGTTEFGGYCFPVYSTLPAEAQSHWDDVKDFFSNSFAGRGLEDLYNARWCLLVCVFLALFFAFAFVKFMDWCAFYVAWATIVLIELSLIGVGTFCWVYKDHLQDEGEDPTNWLEVGAYTSWSLAAIYLLLLACFFKNLRVAIAIIETAADYFADTKRIILIPCLFFAVSLVIVSGWVAAIFCVGSIGEISVHSVAL